VIGLGILLALAYPSAAAARSRFGSARASMERGRAALLRGDAEAAGAAFARAQASFVQGGAQARSPALRILGWLPLLGRTPDAVIALADAGRLTAEGGTDVTGALSSVPGGLEALAPRDGRFDARRLAGLADACAGAADRVASAVALLRETSSTMLLGPVAEARAEALGEVAGLERSLRSGADVLRALPSFLGSDGPRRYFFGAASPSELRGSGGFLGAYSIFTVDRGSIRFAPFRPTETLPSLPLHDVRSPSAGYSRTYDRFGGAAFWPNVNMTPDFPSAAVAIERLYEAGTGDRVDGVITADPFVLRALLTATGPVEVRSLGRTLSDEDVVAFTANEAYSAFGDQERRKTALGSAAAAVFERFIDGTGAPAEAARALAGAVAGGHLNVYADDPEAERAFAAVGAAGRFGAAGGDVLSVIQNNAAANKVDYYVSRHMSYSIQLGAQGTGLATARVELANDAPLRGASTYVLGPHGVVSGRGEHVSYTTLYCASACELESATRDGRVEPQQVGRELGLTSLQDYVRVPSGTSSSLSYRLNLPHAWSGGGTSGAYRLTFLNQPTIRPTSLRVDVQLPEGMRFAGSNLPMRASGGSVSWRGVPGRRLVLEVRFAVPPATAAWHRALDLLTKPLVRLP
jgi:hypothetical protein